MWQTPFLMPWGRCVLRVLHPAPPAFLTTATQAFRGLTLAVLGKDRILRPKEHSVSCRTRCCCIIQPPLSGSEKELLAQGIC